MKRSLPSENDTYFVMLLAITLMPGWRPRAGAMRWASYPRRLCRMTGTSTLDPPFAFFPRKCSRRLHRCTAVGTGEMVVVTDHPSGILPADVACSGRGEVFDVGGCHRHRDGAVDSGVD